MLDLVQKILAKITKRRIWRINRFTPCTPFENGGGVAGNHRRRRRSALPCEASEQKLGQKPKSEIKEIELSFCHHSIFL